MTWQWVTLILGIFWSFVALAAISQYFNHQRLVRREASKDAADSRD